MENTRYIQAADMHCDTISELFERQRKGEPGNLFCNDGHIDLQKMKKGNYILQNFALYTHLKRESKPFAYAMELVDAFYEELRPYSDWIEVARENVSIAYHRRRRCVLRKAGLSSGFLPFGGSNDDFDLELSQ